MVAIGTVLELCLGTSEAAQQMSTTLFSVYQVQGTKIQQNEASVQNFHSSDRRLVEVVGWWLVSEYASS